MAAIDFICSCALGVKTLRKFHGTNLVNSVAFALRDNHMYPTKSFVW
ncbi:hypothetical protein SLEP1_g14962 [Rubroshorea leprosula]|uniref:Uncharacterized protein n=1 Tax=Rubroshorea leprosula TaxID=152421 RepID=A0AAV5IWJ9_9ROSI|nr:hypothetical protein SLEP1_g14962 [Rubroshorea leprosula]